MIDTDDCGFRRRFADDEPDVAAAAMLLEDCAIVTSTSARLLQQDGVCQANPYLWARSGPNGSRTRLMTDHLAHIKREWAVGPE
ncbi:MAG TPA: hypothetical protein VK059_06725 [Nocardioidaceae bacterium]|nr:hypothetical protein [Nocardioidaceae bacterium]